MNAHNVDQEVLGGQVRLSGTEYDRIMREWTEDHHVR